MSMKFFREVTIDNVTPEMLSLEKQGDFTLVWKENTIEIWYQIDNSNLEQKAA